MTLGNGTYYSYKDIKEEPFIDCNNQAMFIITILKLKNHKLCFNCVIFRIEKKDVLCTQFSNFFKVPHSPISWVSYFCFQLVLLVLFMLVLHLLFRSCGVFQLCSSCVLPFLNHGVIYHLRIKSQNYEGGTQAQILLLPSKILYACWDYTFKRIN